jgi:hypothetical protein
MKYNTSVQVYQGLPKQVVVAELLNGITVSNEGNTLVIFQGDTLQPGTFKAIQGNAGEIFSGRIDISFELPVPAPIVPVNMAVVTQKYYVNVEE